MLVKRLFVASAPVMGLCLSSVGAWGQTALFSAETGVSTISPCPSFCGGPGGSSEFDQDGGIGMTTSQSLLNNVDGFGQAQAELLGQVDLPVLRSESFSNEEDFPQRSSRVSAQAFGLQGFYVTGDTYSLDITLTGIANDVPEMTANDFNEDGSALAHVMIIRDNDPSTDINFTSHYPSMKLEFIPFTPDLELLTETFGASGQTLVIPPDNTIHSVSDTLTVTGLSHGELIYIWADLVTSGTRGGFGDAFSTLAMQFEDTTGLSHTPPPPIPEPKVSLVMLVGLGLTSLLGSRRRETSE